MKFGERMVLKKGFALKVFMDRDGKVEISHLVYFDSAPLEDAQVLSRKKAEKEWSKLQADGWVRRPDLD